MEQDKVRGREAQSKIWQQFAGKRFVLAGVDGPEYQSFFQSLAGISSRTGAGFRVVDGVENVLDGDYVLLFVRPSGGRTAENGADDKKAARRSPRQGDDDWEAPFDDLAAHYSWRKAPGSVKAAGEDWHELLGLLPQLRALTVVRPGAVLVISGNEVYGKCFGAPHALRETELGYLCHTDSDDAAAQCMRTAEHFACQLAAQQKLPVRVVRMSALGADGSVPTGTLEACARVLLYGENAQIYNLPGKKRTEADPEEIAYDTENSYIAQMNRRQRGSAVKEPAVGRQTDWQDGQKTMPDGQAGLQDGRKTMPGSQKSGKIVRFRVKEDAVGTEETPLLGRFGVSGKEAAQQRLAGGYPECGPETAGQPAEASVGQSAEQRGGQAAGQPGRQTAGQRGGQTAGQAVGWRADGRGCGELSDGHSPLAPIAIVTDTEKVDRLGK